MHVSGVCVLAVALALLGLAGTGMAQGDTPWPAPVKGWVPVQPEEHPRLFFRKSELPALRQRAQTPEGRQILARLRKLLGGGEEMPTVYNINPPVNIGAKGAKSLPVGAYTMWHGAGFGFLYQMTGDRKYADLARECVEKAFDGQVDRDERYNWVTPGAGLRVGPVMGGIAMAYDLCYDAWDPAFRRRVVKEILDYSHTRVNFGPYNEGSKGPVTMDLLTNPTYPPQSNHFGAYTGGTGMALLAIKGDPGADNARVDAYLARIEKNMIRLMTEGFGDHGWFAEGPGPSHMSVNTGFVPLLQAMKVAAGKDFITPRSNAQWLTMRWAMEIVPRDGKAYYPCRNPSSYGTELVAREGLSDGGEFCQGFGAVTEEQRAALLWTYQHFVEPGEEQANAKWIAPGEKSYDAVVYPQRAIFAFVNWPFGVTPKNPAEVLPKAVEDKARGYYAFRNRWQDGDDILVTAFLENGAPRGYIKSTGGPIMVWGLGMRTTFPIQMRRMRTTFFSSKADGSAVLSAVPLAEGAVTSLAVDYSRASGADALLAMVSPAPAAKIADLSGKNGASTKTTSVTVGDRNFTIMTLQQGAAPEVRVEGDRVVVGGQTVAFDGEKIVLAK